LAQLKFLPFAVQISIPILFITLLVVYKSIMSVSTSESEIIR
jgi:hypothetical protein